MSVTAAILESPSPVTGTRVIRPPDSKLGDDTGLRIGRYSSAEAMRIILHCFFRDAHTVFDWTNGDGGFWKPPYPPGLTIVTNNIDPNAATDLHVDFTTSGLPDAAHDVGVWDPPHLPHLAPSAFMAKRYGTVRSTPAFRAMIEAGAREVWRAARIGIIVKLADYPNGGAYLPLTSWAYEALGVLPVYVMHTVGRPSPRPKGEVGRVPRSNGADWLIFRRDGNRYPDFVKLYERQQSSRITDLGTARCCPICNGPLLGRRRGAATCSDACRQRAYRQRRTA